MFVIAEQWPTERSRVISSSVLRFEHGGFGGGGGGGNSRWVEESRDDGDWSKPTPRNERLEQ